MRNTKGYIHSFQSLGTVDGPGVRAVVFFQGCPLRCSCCHNPDTWEVGQGKLMTAGELYDKADRLRAYFGKEGGITLSGGEPLLQGELALSLLGLCREGGIHRVLDTSGCIIDDFTEDILDLTDMVLLDYKYTNPADYLRHTGMEQSRADEFLSEGEGHAQGILSLLERKRIPTVIRHVVIPTVNDDPESLAKIHALKDSFSCVCGVELLPFRKLCVEKYRRLGIPFPFEHIPEKR